MKPSVSIIFNHSSSILQPLTLYLRALVWVVIYMVIYLRGTERGVVKDRLKKVNGKKFQMQEGY